MTVHQAEADAGRSARRRGRVLGLVLLAVLTTVSAAPAVPGLETLRFAWFDVCQRVAPRARVSAPAVIVEVDGMSLARHGQWPWPRTLLARLLARIGDANPAAIGVDIVMPEPDRLSPQRLPALIPAIGSDLAARLARLPSNDSVLAAALTNRPVVLGIAGVDGTAEDTARSAGRQAPVRIFGGDPAPFVRRFDAALRSLDEIDRAAAGHGLLSVDLVGGAVRRIPLVARVGDTVTPTLGVEMLRVASGQREIVVRVGHDGITGVGVGDLMIPTQGDASVWLRYARPGRLRFIPASDVLAGRTDPAVFRRKLVFVGVTALGLSDRRAIPGGGAMDGVEIHAELVESIFADGLLSRPAWARWGESAFLVVGGLVVILTVPVKQARATVIVLLPLVALATAGSIALYHWGFVLLDAATPTLGLAVLFTTMLGVTLTEAERQRRVLRAQVERQREAAARLEGELTAARRIQMGILPKAADVLAGETRFGLHAVLEPAREVGGDLYDFFMLDRSRLFFLLGDVSGKGLPGSLFMAVSKALYKSTALRHGGGVAMMMREANAEISRDDPEAMFVTLFVGVLDVSTGILEYCNAGHDAPYVVPPNGAGLGQLKGGAGPPLCVLDGFPYEAATGRLNPGDAVCLVTDGVTEATNEAGEFFGRARLEAVLAKAGAAASAEAIAVAIRSEVTQFVAGSEPADDLAILVLRWVGAAAVSGR